MGEHYSLTEMERMYIEARQKMEDAIYEKELYSKDSRDVRWELKNLKQSVESQKEENRKVYKALCDTIFPDYWRLYPHTKGTVPRVIRDWEDGMLGILLECFSSTPVGEGAKCYMQDRSIRKIESSKKDWVTCSN